MRDEDVRGAGWCQVHPGTIKPAAMRTAGAVCVAGWIDQGAAEGLGRNSDIERNDFQRDGPLRVPGCAAVEGAIEGDEVIVEVIPRDIDLPARTHKWHGADSLPRS